MIPGIVCPERSWNLLLWRYSKPAWMFSCGTYSRELVLAGDWSR